LVLEYYCGRRRFTIPNRVHVVLPPQTLIRQGVNAVPQMKYLLGVGAIIGLLSVTVAAFKDLRVAVIGTLLLLVAMSVVVIFARVAALDGGLRLPALMMTWFSLFLMMGSGIALFTSVFWSRPLDLSRWLAAECVVDPADPGKCHRSAE